MVRGRDTIGEPDLAIERSRRRAWKETTMSRRACVVCGYLPEVESGASCARHDESAARLLKLVRVEPGEMSSRRWDGIENFACIATMQIIKQELQLASHVGPEFESVWECAILVGLRF